MTKYVLDTNLYVQAFRSDAGAEGLREFYASHAPVVWLHAIVVHELLVGANTAKKQRQIDRVIARPFRRTARVITPSAAAWELAGRALGDFARAEHRDLRTVPKSLVNDFLLAVSCREGGFTIVTSNVADFETIDRYIPVSYSPAWPE